MVLLVLEQAYETFHKPAANGNDWLDQQVWTNRGKPLFWTLPMCIFPLKKQTDHSDTLAGHFIEDILQWNQW